VALFGALALPFVINNEYLLRVCIIAILYSILAVSLNIVVGFTGMFSLGHAGFYAVGAYVAALLALRLHTPYLLSLLCSMLAAGLVGFILSIPSFRLGGDYLAVVTLGFSEIIRLIATNWMELTRGPLGLPGIPPIVIFSLRVDSYRTQYYFILVLAVLAFTVVIRVINSQIGRCLKSVREDELAAAAMGVNVRYYKSLAFVISAILTGACGSFLAHFLTIVSPMNFRIQESILLLEMVILGGMGSIPGSILGAVLLVAIPEYLQIVPHLRMLFGGLTMLLMIRFRPQGLLGGREISLRGRPKLVRTTRT